MDGVCVSTVGGYNGEGGRGGGGGEALGDIPNADKHPSRSNSQVSVSQTWKVSQSQPPSKYHNNNSFFPPKLLYFQLPNWKSTSVVKNPAMNRFIVPFFISTYLLFFFLLMIV